MKTKSKFWIYPIVIIGFVYMFAYGCKKDEESTPPTTVTDIDGNTYNTVTIGTQVWMTENLKTTKYNDGTAIPNETNYWGSLKTPAYCWYNNDSSNKDVYGALYNWYAVNTNKLCPTGWHVPSDAEWTTLTTYLGGKSVAGGKLKETGTIHWQSPNTGATNESGFTALPSGYCNGYSGSFDGIGYNGDLWSSTASNNIHAYSRILDYDLSSVYKNFDGSDWEFGFAVRCLRD